MKNILFINACTRPDSRTEKLAGYLLGKLDGNVVEINLYKENIKPLDASMIEKRDSLLSLGKSDDSFFDPANQFAAADIIVVAAPYWDLLFPAVLRTYLETVTVCGITFRYSEKGAPTGLCRAEKLYYVTTAGGFIGKNSFGFDYVKTLAETFYGIKKAECFSAEGLDIFGADTQAIMCESQKAIDKALSASN